MMPDAFEHYFELLGERVEDYLELVRLTPSYRIFFQGSGQKLDMESDVAYVKARFEEREPGAGAALDRYLARSGEEYAIAKKYFLYRNYNTFFDFIGKDFVVHGRRFSLFANIHDYYRKFFQHPELLQIMEYIMVFLGGSPYKTPALYAMLNYIDFALGTYYPQGGIYTLIEALVKIGEKNGVTFRTECPVAQIRTVNGTAVGVTLKSGETIDADVVISNADRHHTETKLLAPSEREYSESYWKKRVQAPSAFILYLGIRGRVPQLTHHNFVFSEQWEQGFRQIFDEKTMPTAPSLYVCAPSVTDPSVAPEGCENLFVLVPIPSDVPLSESEKAAFTEKTLAIIAEQMKIPDLRERIVYQRVYTSDDFQRDYNSFGGSALGMAHTLDQSAAFRPNNVSKKVKNLYYVGASTNPGIGMPICLISAELAYKRLAGISHPHPLERL